MGESHSKRYTRTRQAEAAAQFPSQQGEIISTIPSTALTRGIQAHSRPS